MSDITATRDPYAKLKSANEEPSIVSGQYFLKF